MFVWKDKPTEGKITEYMDMARRNRRIDNKMRSCERMKVVGYEAVRGGSRLNCLSLTQALLPFRSRHRSPLYSPSFLSLPRLTRRSSRLHFIVCSHMGTHVLLIAVGACTKTKKTKVRSDDDSSSLNIALFVLGSPASGRIWLPLYLGISKV